MRKLKETCKTKDEYIKKLEEKLWYNQNDLEASDKMNSQLVRRNYRLEQANRKLIEALSLITDNYKDTDL